MLMKYFGFLTLAQKEKFDINDNNNNDDEEEEGKMILIIVIIRTKNKK